MYSNGFVQSERAVRGLVCTAMGLYRVRELSEAGFVQQWVCTVRKLSEAGFVQCEGEFVREL